MTALTGNDIKTVRDRSGLSACELADLVGVGCSSIYRWEDAGKTKPKIEGRPRNLFSIMLNLKQYQMRDIAEAFREGGWILALNKLTSFAYKKPSRQADKAA